MATFGTSAINAIPRQLDYIHGYRYSSNYLLEFSEYNFVDFNASSIQLFFFYLNA